MGKRSNFRRRKQDRYFTPPEAVEPLLSHLGGIKYYIEPCYGEGHIVAALKDQTCIGAYDIERLSYRIKIWDAATACGLSYIAGADAFITNPPWTRELLHPIIENLSNQLPTWLIFDASWKYTVQKHMAKRIGCKTVPGLLKRCVKIVAVGRVSWMQNGTSSLDDCAWYLFDKNFTGQTEFYGKQEK